MSARTHPIGDRHTELLVGLVLFALGAWLIRDAHEGRGRKTPWPLSLVTPY